MSEVLLVILLVACTLAASVLSAVTGFGGGAAALHPVWVAMFDMREAAPILIVAQLIGNGSRFWINREEIHLALTMCYRCELST